MKVYKQYIVSESNSEQPVIIRIGDEIFSPASNYGPENKENYIVTTVEEIYEENGDLLIVDSDGDVLKAEWLGTSFFRSKEEMELRKGETR